MKNLIQIAIVATLAIGASASSHHHMHRHAKKQAGSQADKRDGGGLHQRTTVLETVYELNGQIVDPKKAEEGLKDGEYVVVGESSLKSTPPPPAQPKPEPPAAKKIGAQFLEKQPQDAPAPAVPTVPSSPPPKKDNPPKDNPPKDNPPKDNPPKDKSPKDKSPKDKSPKDKSPASSDSPSNPGGKCDGSGVDKPFPSGKYKCSELPCGYGAVSLDWLDMGGFSGIQYVPDFTMGVSVSISSIITGVKGDKCSPGSLCSYSCGPGYQKTQWPSAQGATKQSAGGLHCNHDGYLELTRPSVPTLCERGAGGVFIENDLDVIVSTCRTDYPGTESMVIPLVAQPHSEIEVTNPVQDDYYIWDGKPTSAQYYINKKGIDASECCLWDCAIDPLGCGNWAPMILGVGQAKDGVTFLSIFQNLPTSTALLDFNVEITGDVNSKCAFKNGQWIGGQTGCTTGMKKGGKATIRFF